MRGILLDQMLFMGTAALILRTLILHYYLASHIKLGVDTENLENSASTMNSSLARSALNDNSCFDFDSSSYPYALNLYHSHWASYNPVGGGGWYPSWVGKNFREVSEVIEKTGKEDPNDFIDGYLRNATQLGLILLEDCNDHNARHQQNPQAPIKRYFVDNNYTAHHFPMLAFIRIPKTGSTSLLSWVGSNGGRSPHYECILGPLDSQKKFPNQFQQEYLSCPHRPYDKMVFHWAREILPLVLEKQLKIAETSFSSSSSYQQPSMRQASDFSSKITYSLDFFTIVRDPFDRLVSHFNYVRKIYPGWSGLSTPEQNASILANDISGWMELLYSQGTRKARHLPYQMDELTELDASVAREMITGNLPRVFTVIHECFDASLWLLTEHFPAFFSPATTKSFLNSSHTRHNTKSVFQMENQRRNTNELTELKKKARNWFQKDYIFYDAAVDQFIERLLSSNVEPFLIGECLQKLGRADERAS